MRQVGGQAALEESFDEEDEDDEEELPLGVVSDFFSDEPPESPEPFEPSEPVEALEPLAAARLSVR